MKTPKDGFRIVWFTALELVMSFIIITVSIKTNLFTALAFAGLVLLLGAYAMSKYSKTNAGIGFVVRNKLLNTHTVDTVIDAAPTALKDALDSWKLVFIVPFSQLKKGYATIESHFAAKEVSPKEIHQRTSTLSQQANKGYLCLK